MCVLKWRLSNEGRSKHFPQNEHGSIFLADGLLALEAPLEEWLLADLRECEVAATGEVGGVLVIAVSTLEDLNGL